MYHQPHRRKDTTTTFSHHPNIATRTDPNPPPPPHRRRIRRVVHDHSNHPPYYYCHPRTIMLQPQLLVPLRKPLRFVLGLLRNPYLIGFVVGILVTLIMQQQQPQPVPLSLPPTDLTRPLLESRPPHTLRRHSNNNNNMKPPSRGTFRSLRDIPAQESKSHPGIFKQSLFDRRSSSSTDSLPDDARIMGISVATIHPGQSIARHGHVTMTELFYVLEGEVEITLYPNDNHNDTSHYTCAYGCYYTAIPNVPHSFTVRPDAPLDAKLLVIQLLADDDDDDHDDDAATNATTTRSSS